MATKKYLDQQGLQTLIQGLKAKNDILYAAAGHAHAASEISYKNANIKNGADIKVDEALDVLVANIVKNTEQISTTTHNMKDLDEAIKALQAQIGEGTVADKIQAVQTALNNFKSTQATKDGEQDTAIEKAQSDATLAIADAAAAQATANGATTAVAKAQGEIDALELVVGDENSGLVKKVNTLEGASHTHTNKAELDKFVTGDKDALDNAVAKVTGNADTEGTIAEAKKAGTDAAKAEADRAKGVEAELRTDLGEKGAAADAEGSAFARIAKVKADLAAKAAQDDVDALEAKVGVVPADKTVVQMIADAKTEATYDDTALTIRVKAIEDDYLKAADKTELQGKIDAAKEVADDAKGKIDAFLDANAVKDDTINTLKEIQEYITTHGQAAATMTNNIAANAQAIKDEAERAKKAEKANADAIDKLNGADTEEGSVAKAVKDAKDAVMTEVNKKVAQADYDTKVAALEKADTDNLAAAKKYADDQDAEIEAILGHKAIEGGEAATGLCADVAANAAAIAAEATARQAADTALDGRLDTIEGEGEGSIKKALADAKQYTDDQIDAMALTDKEINDMLTAVYGAQA